MRILYSHYLTNDDHPAARMTASVAQQLSSFGHEVRIHRSSDLGQASAGTKQMQANSSWLKRQAWFLKELSRNRAAYRRDLQAIDEYQPDVVLCRQDAYRYSMSLAAQRRGVPVVIYADAPVAYESRHYNTARRWHPPALVEQIERWCLSRSRGIVTVSTTAKRILESYRLAIPINVASNGVNTSQFFPRCQESRDFLRSELNIKTPLVAGFVGSFRSFHGIPLLKEMILATRHRKDLTWLLVGDGPERQELVEACAHLPQVRFTGRVEPSRVPDMLSTLDVLVSPYQQLKSDYYFSPLKLLEAMASSVCCLAAKQGDNEQLLGVAGRLIDGNQVDKWTGALNALLDSPLERNFRSNAGRQRATMMYTWNQTAKIVEHLLEQALLNLRKSIAKVNNDN